MRRWRQLGLALLATVLLFGVLFVFVIPHRETATTALPRPSAATPSPAPTASRPVPTPTPTPSNSSVPVPTPRHDCLAPDAQSQPYANEPKKAGGPKAFGPEVDATYGVTAVIRELSYRLCGTATHGPDERLWAAIDAVLNHTDANLAVSHQVWADGVDKLVDSQLMWQYAKLATLDVPDGTTTFEMTPGSFPLISRVTPSTQRDQFLVIEATTSGGQRVTLVLRLKCGFQPYLGAIVDSVNVTQ